MKIACTREKLLSAFQTAATVVNVRSPKTVLQNVRMNAQGDSVSLVATDMEVSIRIEIPDHPAEVPGSALLSVAQFGSILRESSDETLLIETDEQGVVVSGERSRFRFPSGNPAEFPDVFGFDASNYYVVKARLFRELVRRTLFATDTESSRYALGGVLLEFEEERLTAVGTDGRRLAKMDGPYEQEGEPTTGDAMTIVPTRSMQLIERTLTDLDADVHLAVRGNDLVVRTPETTVITRLVEGRFPRWRDVLPNRPDATNIDISAGPMLAAIRQAAIVSNKEHRGIRFAFGNGSLVLSGVTADVGESRIEVPIAYDGEEIVLSLDHRFVIDFLKVLDAETSFTVNLLDSDSAALFETDDGYAYVLMPLALEQQVTASGAAAGSA